ncbi:MAG TPA: flagellar hook-length control protein FliK [Burkholderiaceae bacterium]|jgi:flagellar hook-length control protein FliK
MMVSAAPSGASASAAIVSAAPQSVAPGAPTADSAPASATSTPASAASAPTSPSAATAAATPASTAAQAGPQASPPEAPAASRGTPGAEPVPRFSDMLRAANDEDAAGADHLPTASQAAPNPDSDDTSKSGSRDDAASAAIALAMWPGMAAPVTVVPSGVAPAAQASSTNRTGRGAASVLAADATPATDAGSGPAAPLSTARPIGAAAGQPLDAALDAPRPNPAAPARPAIGFRPAMDDASASPEPARAAVRPDAAVTTAPRERVAVTAPMPNPGAMPNAAGWSTPAAGGPAAELPTVTVKLPPQSPDQWNQPLTDALGDRLQVQLSRGSDQAVIRLDPPMLGSVEISIRHEAGSLQVQLSASNGDVLRQLHGIGDTLRQDLAQHQSGDVSVVVSDSSRDAGGADSQRGRGRQRDAQQTNDEPGQALAEAETGSAQTPFSFSRGRE